MRIMLVAEHRTGSTSIVKYYNEANHTFEVFNEPFNGLKKIPTTYENVLKFKNSFVKQLYNQISTTQSTIEFYDMVCHDFDKVIFLSRRDIEKQAESFSSALVTDNWEGQYVYNHDKVNLELTSNSLIEMKKEAIEVAKKHNLKVFYYEDIFYNKDNMLEFLNEIECPFNEGVFKKYLDTSKKYRFENITKSVI